MKTRCSFKDCVDGDTNVVDEWLRQCPDGVRANFDSLFKYLAVTADWSTKKTRMLKGKFSSLIEFKERQGKVQYRIAGFHWPGRQVILCCGWTHSENSAAQKAAMRRALTLKQRFEQGEVRTVDHI